MDKTADKRSSLSPSSSNRITPRPTSRVHSTERATKGRRASTASLEKGFDADEGSSFEMSRNYQMQLEKELYPGAKSWARDEERLFEILFTRQDLPMLPPSWDVDFSGVPISDTIFHTNERYPAIVYAHSKDFRGRCSFVALSRAAAND